jgi:hypothetical protein
MLILSQDEFEATALALGYKQEALRQWRHRRRIPATVRNRLTHFYDEAFELVEQPATPRPAGGTTLASQAAKYIK